MTALGVVAIVAGASIPVSVVAFVLIRGRIRVRGGPPGGIASVNKNVDLGTQQMGSGSGPTDAEKRAKGGR